ncbi:MAG TPA: hypothetical protein VEJ20_03535 [Candidatus Eremiobacteraceae bacterium]|nr:hypothetical protein [Candidatus Eremiobacteraceae bacterium]
MHLLGVIVGVYVALISTKPVASTPATLHAHPKPAPKLLVAPADEYFGRMKMSILGITNSIRDTGLREGFNPTNAASYYSGLMWTEDALKDWAAKYPHDGWIPRRAYDLSHDFWRMHMPQADAAAQACRQLLFRQFPHDHWTAIARSETAAKVAPPVAVATPQPATTPAASTGASSNNS